MNNSLKEMSLFLKVSHVCVVPAGPATVSLKPDAKLEQEPDPTTSGLTGGLGIVHV